MSHHLAGNDSSRNLIGDDQLFGALVSGCHVENAAAAAGMSVRTAYRRLADPEFRSQLDQARRSLRESILAKLSDAGHDAVGTLWELMQESEDDSVRLRAAKAVLDSLRGFHEHSPVTETTVKTFVEHKHSVCR